MASCRIAVQLAAQKVYLRRRDPDRTAIHRTHAATIGHEVAPPNDHLSAYDVKRSA